MLSWLKYAKVAANTGISNIEGKQDERIDELKNIAIAVLSGKSFAEVFDEKKVDYYNKLFTNAIYLNPHY
jgi:hypothetical protein